MASMASGGPARETRAAASIAEQIRLFVDPGTFESWDGELLPPFAPTGHLDARYEVELVHARERTGLDEAVITCAGNLGGHRVAIIACDFRFLAGSIGVAGSQRLLHAIERATAEGLPLLASPTSGGTRMQEGTVAFLQMVAISNAVAAHRRAGLPYLVYLRHPTTGGVFASWGSLAHITAAEPGALIGFLGPRVYQALYGEPFPENVQTAENLFECGLIDAVIAPERLRRITIRVLDVLGKRILPIEDSATLSISDVSIVLPAEYSAWDSIQRTRRPERPGVRALLRVAATEAMPLRGTGEGEDDAGIILALARFGAHSCVVLGHDRRGPKPLGPGGLRVARRGMALAEELGLPLITVVDTAGAALSVEAEQGGLAGEIARCLAELASLQTWTVCLLLGQGTGGGALALLPADRVLAAEHAWLSPLPPEGASVIRFRTPDRAAEMATAQGVCSRDLLRNGVVDRIVPELPDAADEPESFMTRLGSVLAQELAELSKTDIHLALKTRLQRYRSLGTTAASPPTQVGCGADEDLR